MQFPQIAQDARQHIQNFLKKYPRGVIIIYGPTATGKTKLSIELANYFPLEIISADSRQIFKNMNIWTDKISETYLKTIPHHQINIIAPDQKYTAWERQVDSKRHIKNIQKRGNIPCIVGWTGLYIDTIYKNFTLPNIPPNYKLRTKLEQLEKDTPWYLYNELKKIDPEEAKKNHPKSTRYLIRALEIYYESGKTKTETCKEQAVDQPLCMIWIHRDTEITKQLIKQRIQEMIDQGLVEEVENLLKKYHPTLQSMQGIGYKEVIPYIQWEYDQETMIQSLTQNTVHLAKKQRTRWRRYSNDAKNNPKKYVEYINYEIE